MPNFIDCMLTITGPNRQAVLDKIKGDPYESQTVYFDVEKIIRRPEGADEDWSCENWGCRTVYRDGQWYRQEKESDVIGFCTSWNPPLRAIQALTRMYPKNTFLLQDSSDDGLPNGTTLFRGGKSSRYYSLPNYNSNTGKTATLYEIFCAVLRRKGTVEEALAEVERVKALRLHASSSEQPADSPVDDPDHDLALDEEVEAFLKPFAYEVAMIPGDLERIGSHIAGDHLVVHNPDGRMSPNV